MTLVESDLKMVEKYIHETLLGFVSQPLIPETKEGVQQTVERLLAELGNGLLHEPFNAERDLEVQVVPDPQDASKVLIEIVPKTREGEVFLVACMMAQAAYRRSNGPEGVQDL